MTDVSILKRVLLEKSRQELNNTKVTGDSISINDQPYTEIEPNVFKTFVHVKLIAITNCDINKISKDTFKQSSNLKNEQFSKLNILDLNHNRISEIESDTFFYTKNLESLNLSNNLIQKVNKRAFRKLKQLREVLLKNNKLVSIERHIFKNLANLTVIDLSHNFIHTLRDDTFHDLPSLISIDLSSNNLHKIEPFAFSNLPSLETLSLRDNYLTSLSDETFKALRNDKTQMCIDLAGNECIKYNFEMIQLFNHLHSSSLIRLDEQDLRIFEMRVDSICDRGKPNAEKRCCNPRKFHKSNINDDSSEEGI
jgi:Leucine-rich repeat (LRR) protein